jgi:phospholipid/cholesterol/gamma-HCH transport system substrate-binding protein
MIDELQQGKGTAGKLLKDEELYNNVNKTIANIKQLTDDINAGKGGIGKIAHDKEFADKLQITMNNLASLSQRLENGEGTAGMLLKDPALYNNSNQMLVETRELVKSIRENPKKYLTFKVKVF